MARQNLRGIWWFPVLTVFLCAGRGSAAEPAAKKLIPIDQAEVILAPYVWKMSGKGPSARAEAMLPGAYLKAEFRGSATIALVVDASANHDCPPTSMPVVEYSIDDGPFVIVSLKPTGDVYSLSLADRLDPAKPHRVELYFRAADLARNRWRSSTAHLRLGGLTLDARGTMLAGSARNRRAIGFGDSITEGVGVDGLFTSWQKLGVNNARATWLPIVCAALGCEYGQLGSGGQGMTRAIELPPLPQTWDRYDAATSRLTGGLLLPEPDYIFCAMGTNDYEKVITADYAGWLKAMRQACPHARFFCVVPPLGVHRAEVAAALSARNQAGDRKVHLVDTAPLERAFRAGQGATKLAHDGVHPSEYGQALLGALIAVEVQKIVSESR